MKRRPRFAYSVSSLQRQNKGFDDRNPKKPVSVTKKALVTIIKAFISAYDSSTQELAEKIKQKWPL